MGQTARRRKGQAALWRRLWHDGMTMLVLLVVAVVIGVNMPEYGANHPSTKGADRSMETALA